MLKNCRSNYTSPVIIENPSIIQTHLNLYKFYIPPSYIAYNCDILHISEENVCDEFNTISNERLIELVDILEIYYTDMNIFDT